MGGAVDEHADELRLPGAPGRGAGGDRVGLGEGVEQAQGREVAHRVGDVGEGAVVGEVAAGGHVGQQQVVAHHLLERGRVVGPKPMRGPMSATISMPTSVWSPG